MALTPGTRLWYHEVIAKIGEGGMSACGNAKPGGEASPLVRGGGGAPAAGAEDADPEPVPSDRWR